MKKKTQKHSNLNFDTVSLIYQTKKQFWSISNRGVKKRISKIFFDFLLSQKKLISYEDSKIFKKGVPFNVLPTEIEVIFNDVKQSIKILNPISVRYNFMDLFCGAGGLSEGLINAGLTSILCLDNNKDACLTLKKNHSHSVATKCSYLPTKAGCIFCRDSSRFHFIYFCGNVDPDINEPLMGHF